MGCSIEEAALVGRAEYNSVVWQLVDTFAAVIDMVQNL